MREDGTLEDRRLRIVVEFSEGIGDDMSTSETDACSPDGKAWDRMLKG